MNGTVIHPVIAVMQPYFFPYLGYYQMAAYVDAFVFVDVVKKGFIHRNQIELMGSSAFR